MTFLKKLGTILAEALKIVVGFGPTISQMVPGAGGVVQIVSADLEAIAQVIMSIEAVGAAVTPAMTGAQKLQAATPLVAQAILQSSVLVGRGIADPAKFKLASQELAQGMVDLLNSLDATAVQTITKTSAPVAA